MPEKPQLHANLTEEAMRLLKAIAASQGVTVTAILEVMIRAEAKRKRIKLA